MVIRRGPPWKIRTTFLQTTLSMVVIHDDIARYIGFMKMRMAWYGSADRWDNSLVDRTQKFYTGVRWILCIILCVVNGAALSTTDDFGLFDGTFVYFPLSLVISVLNTIAAFSGRQQETLTMSLNQYFILHNDSRMKAIKNKYIHTIWKYLNYYFAYNNSVLVLYLTGPLVVDTILHYGFDYLERPFTLPMAFTPLLRDNCDWNLKYYVITALSVWATVEIVSTLQWFIASYSLLAIFFLTELVIFKHQVRSLDLEAPIELKAHVKEIVTWHNNIIKLNRELKSYLGLSSAFNSFFISLALTFTSFTVYTSSNIPLVMAYGSGFTLNLSSGLLFSYIGQLIENESEEVFRATYNLPWYRYTPQARKSLNMVIRQARTPLTIDFHGRSRMNLTNFMQMLRSSYSYFTLLQSMIPK